MFTKQTVIVLGAGASWHYGYPTGAQLVADVTKCADLFRAYCEVRLNGSELNVVPKFMLEGAHKTGSYQKAWVDQLEQCLDLIDRLKNIEPVVIDYFLGWNAPLHDLGRTMIALALLEREANGAGRTNYNRWVEGGARAGIKAEHFDYRPYKDRWVRYVVHQLMLQCKTSEQLLENNVHFVTFNYDTSFETNLRRALGGAAFLEQANIDAFLGNGRVLHMYGELAAVGTIERSTLENLSEKQTQISNWGKHIHLSNELLNAAWDAGASLRVIDPHTKIDDATVTRARDLILGAENIYFLGFGFDQNNLSRLGFPLAAPYAMSRRYSFTNMGNSLSVNKGAARAFRIPQVAQMSDVLVSIGGTTLEKSTRDTYQAIELDFAAFDA